jgi:hypothetical protein
MTSEQKVTWPHLGERDRSELGQQFPEAHVEGKVVAVLAEHESQDLGLYIEHDPTTTL